MAASLPASLETAALSRRLGELVGDERAVQVDFLVHLDEYDRRRAWLEAGFSSLWDYLTRGLHYREGAAYRRMKGMTALRRVPTLADALRDGRVCLTTLALLEPHLTAENEGDLVARAAFASKSDVEHLVASIHPRAAPKDGLRRLPVRQAASPAALSLTTIPRPEVEPRSAAAASAAPDEPVLSPPGPLSVIAAEERRPTLTAVARDTWSLNITVDGELKQELQELKSLLSHKIPDGNLNAIMREAVRCAIEKHGRRKGAVVPSRKRKQPAMERRPSPAGRQEPTAEVRRQVYERDQGRCRYVAPDGRRCGSTWQVEIHHVGAAALGGPATLANLELRCRGHNRLEAERVFGRAHMERFRREPRAGESSSPSESSVDGAGSLAPAPDPRRRPNRHSRRIDG